MLFIFRQDKGRRVVLLDRNTYLGKCLQILNTPNFQKLSADPTKLLEIKVQNALREIKYCFDKRTYHDLYPSGSNPAKFYGNAKVHN